MNQSTDKKVFAQAVGSQLGIDFSVISIDEFSMGLQVELEHGSHDPETNVTDNDIVMTGKIAWAHLKELPDYYTRLHKMESEAKAQGKAT